MGTSSLVVQNLYQSLEHSVESRPDGTALFFEGHKYSYRQFQHSVQASLFCLTERFKLQKGDAIVLALGNRPEFCFLFYAAMALGVVVVPLSTKLKSDDSMTVLESVDAKVVFYDPDSQPWLSTIASETQKSLRVSLSNWQFMVRNVDNQAVERSRPQTAVNADDVAAIIYTSGTTGSPKGAAITHSNFLHAINAYRLALGLNENDSTVLPIPICHITGLSALLCLFVHIGGTIHLHQRFSADEILRAIEQHGITFLHGSPTVFILLTQEAEKHEKSYDYASLRMIACGAGHLNTGIIGRLSALFPHTEIRPIYGLTETTSPASIFPMDVRRSDKIGSSGLPIPGLECQIRDDGGRPLSAGETGHLWLKGPVVIKRYWNNEKVNRQYFNNGWFYTGDIASIDKDNYLFIKDRSKDMINRGGEKIYCIEIENLISNYPGVKDIAIVPKHSDIYGEEAVAFIIADRMRPLVSDNITQWLSERIAKFKIPSKIIFVSELPKNANGKTDKVALRQRANCS
ncbi:AMP-dependent ligase [Leminorella grimontii]|uniref:AMP-dependent ligase n=1 Tax=Leminorella grimontii TaxID=82981 RepID=A0AAV5N191_9GAMM|nr:class I adenylate-forming enzyme family protein [Leminorella grimontii]KFC93853.1 long-chain-fatty-acid--CoA ligase [Leminorella grimontii ATCC 33999 = DSM 5078]GKX55449.1 AMP-dependent ligase [Leminorella grimontii]VFS55753.1 Short-chain-fatty-acid--CoA ligase [Leminorella grimontii]